MTNQELSLTFFLHEHVLSYIQIVKFVTTHMLSYLKEQGKKFVDKTFINSPDFYFIIYFSVSDGRTTRRNSSSIGFIL